MTNTIGDLLNKIAACRVCVDTPAQTPLPHEPRPVTVISSLARIRIIGQAPGVRVHQSGKPFTDPSGDRLREWMGMDAHMFYDADRLSITPMGFCFPGLDKNGGDLPPRTECAPHWHDLITQAMPQIRLVLLVGMYAQRYYLGKLAAPTLTETVKNWHTIFHKTAGPAFLPLPHPSWRNNGWIARNPWFTHELLPFLRSEIQRHV